eukprot:RCo031562
MNEPIFPAFIVTTRTIQKLLDWNDALLAQLANESQDGSSESEVRQLYRNLLFLHALEQFRSDGDSESVPKATRRHPRAITQKQSPTPMPVKRRKNPGELLALFCSQGGSTLLDSSMGRFGTSEQAPPFALPVPATECQPQKTILPPLLSRPPLFNS